MDGGVTGEETSTPASAPQSYSDIFDAVYPQYLMMGMTPEEYWDGEVGLLKARRDAFVLMKEREERERDTQAWLTGMYIRDALQSVYLMVNGFVPKGVTATPYPNKPYSTQEQERIQEEKRQKAEEKRKQAEDEKVQQSMAYFQAAVAQFNKNIRKRNEAKKEGRE